MKSCPFCGNIKLKVESKRSNDCKFVNGVKYYTYTFSVRCNCCHARGPAVSQRIEADNYDKELFNEAEARAYEVWDKRKTIS